MLRFVLAAVLVSCAGPTSVTATLSPLPTAKRSAVIVTAPPTATVRSSPTAPHDIFCTDVKPGKTVQTTLARTCLWLCWWRFSR